MSQPLPASPKVIGRYTILRELRRERHSVSYAAVDPVMNRDLVLKTVQIVPAGPPLRAENRRRVEQAFVRQAQAAGRLHHPNILTVFDAGLSHEFGYLVIERVAGRSLQDLLGAGVKFTDLQCAGIGARLADALEYAHAQGVAHGQLGPQHVYIQADGAPKISGFGGWIDGGTEGDDALTRTEQFLPYFQNEVIDETRQRDVRLIASLLCALIQARPHAVSMHPNSARSTGAEGAAALSALLLDALDPNSPSAPKTAAELRDALIAVVWAERSDRAAAAALGVSLAMTMPRPAAPRTAAPTVKLPPEAAVHTPVEGPSEWLAPLTHAAVADLRAWARQHRLALSLGAAVVLSGLTLGNLLGRLRPIAEPAAQTTAPQAPGRAAQAAGDAGAAEAGSGSVLFRIQPWGEILVDHKRTGVSPPLLQMALSSGEHQIEVHHGSDPPWVVQIHVEAAVPVTVSHRFE